MATKTPFFNTTPGRDHVQVESQGRPSIGPGQHRAIAVNAAGAIIERGEWRCWERDADWDAHAMYVRLFAEAHNEVYDGFGPHGEPDGVIRNGTNWDLYEHDRNCDCPACYSDGDGEH